MSDEPQISVLLPARNAAATVQLAIEDVLAQEDAPPFELVLVDDASTDATGEIARAWAARDARVHVLRGAGTGLVDALNLGLASCRAPLVARMDADDRTHPSRLRLQSDWLAEHPRAGAVGSLVRLTPRPLTPGLSRLEDWLDSVVTEEQCAAARFIESPLVHPSMMLRKSALGAVGNYLDRGWAEDWDLLLRLSAAGYGLGKVPAVLVEWRDSPERLTRTGLAYRAQEMVRLRAFHLAQGPLLGREFDLWGACPTGKQLARALEAHGLFPRRFIDIDPRKRIARGKAVLQADALGAPDGALIVCAVGAAGARESIRAWLTPRGHSEGRDYLFAA
jgi:cellulose synthase/poly-beta-1,6-N-acetylglucosamine synthase-like glycosyltransferase